MARLSHADDGFVSEAQYSQCYIAGDSLDSQTTQAKPLGDGLIHDQLADGDEITSFFSGCLAWFVIAFVALLVGAGASDLLQWIWRMMQ